MFTSDPSHLTTGELESMVARTFTFYDNHDRGFEWKTFDHDRSDLRPLLAQHGARPEPSEALVLGDASALAGDGNAPAGLTLRAVTSRADLERVAALESEVWAEDWSWLADDLEARLAGTAPVEILLVEDKERAVSAAWLVPLAGTQVAGLWGGGTLAAYRGRGIYRALVSRRARIAVERGYSTLQVDASEDSRPILERLGLHAVGRTVPYVTTRTRERTSPDGSESSLPDSVRRTSQPQAGHDVALVLGGGGAAGNAWEIGVIAGLAEAGLDLTEAADLVIGTSAGATAAAQVRSGIPAAALLASVLSEPVPPVGRNRERPPSLPMATVFERMRAIGAAATSAADLQRAMGAFGLESDSTLGPSAGQRRAVVAARLPRPEWPDRPMVVVAIDAHTGELAAFDRESGVDLVDAVTASCALPGLAPTQSINGTRYIDGGVRSTENADLASGYANVVVLSPLGGRSQTPPGRDAASAGQFEGLRRPPEWGTDLASQVEALRKRGSHVDVITPDADSRAAMGTNHMDPATRIPAARAGFAQGKQEAARVTFL